MDGKIGKIGEWKWSLELTRHQSCFSSFRLPRGLGRGVGSQQPSQQESLRKVQSGLSGAGILIFGCLKLKDGRNARNMTCDRLQVWHEIKWLILSSHIKLWIEGHGSNRDLKLHWVLTPLGHVAMGSRRWGLNWFGRGKKGSFIFHDQRANSGTFRELWVVISAILSKCECVKGRFV